MRIVFALALAAYAVAAPGECDLHVVVSVDETQQTPDEPGHSMFYATGNCGMNVSAGPEGTCAVFGPHCDASDPREPDCRSTIDTGMIVLEGKFEMRPAQFCGHFSGSGACFVCLDKQGEPFVRVAYPGTGEEIKGISADPLSDEKPWSLLPDVLKLATNKPSANPSPDDELPYPLPEVADLITVMVHALHCRHVMKEGKSESAMDRMHQEHCGKFHQWHTDMRQKIDTPSRDTCAIMFGFETTEEEQTEQSEDYLRQVGLGGSYSYGYLGGQDADRKASTSQDYLKMVGLAGSYSYGYLGGEGIDRKAKNPSADYLKMVGLGGGYSYGYLNGNQGRDWLLAQNGVVQNPRGFLPQLAGYGYGTLLMKQWNAETDLTKAEQQYMDSWETPMKLKQGALAYACTEYPGMDIYE